MGSSAWRAGELLGERAGNVDSEPADLGKCLIFCRRDLPLGPPDLLCQRIRELAVPFGGLGGGPLGGLPDRVLRLGARLGEPRFVGALHRLRLGSRLGGAGEVLVEPGAPQVDGRAHPRQGHQPHQQVEHEKADRQPEQLRNEGGDVELRHLRASLRNGRGTSVAQSTKSSSSEMIKA